MPQTVLDGLTIQELRELADSLIGKNFRKKKAWRGRRSTKQVTKWRQANMPVPNGTVRHVIQVRVQNVRLEDGLLYGQAEYWSIHHLMREYDQL